MFMYRTIKPPCWTAIKGLVAVILCWSVLISSWFKVTVTAYWKHLLSFLLTGFIVAFLIFMVFHRYNKLNLPNLFLRVYNLVQIYYFVCGDLGGLKKFKKEIIKEQGPLMEV